MFVVGPSMVTATQRLSFPSGLIDNSEM
jgi:hypothetical protein